MDLVTASDQTERDVHSWVFFLFFCTGEPVLTMCLRDIKNVLAKDRCLLNTGAFQFNYFFREMNRCLLNTCCLFNKGGH